METLQAYFENKGALIQQALRSLMEEMSEVPDRLRESMSYSLLAGGKRLRPLLVLATSEALGGDEKQALPFACAVEMIHTYSLIHDDLPAMDNDDYRRGRLTNHKVFGDAMAILAGDALLTKAFGIMASAAKEAGMSADSALSLIEEASIRAGAEGMVGGQVKDILGENQQLTLEELQSIHRSKTGDLLTLSVRMGALVANAQPDQLSALTKYAERLGLAFQIQDDILDIVGDKDKLGKPVGSDEEKHKSTYPALLGLEESRRWVKRLAAEAKELVLHEGIWAERLIQIADFLVTREQ
ncbi:farnesyl-diphosphate synthase [Marinithermofilum abyssi]|uniref:Farnesyl diphosphate synthase n=1 Tax=Marinithermofilum abyssi TaxID=1571185 RepID=A0A8J2VGL6_9BACL|nr:farnesyl diphosphate synthase [Marinithermofilum abyssi]GGE10414.1 farnesyl-diphosphate synthase [Marinithermofilum abyssi]